ncbi:gamma-interferon-inducible lysosomal thiol reductase-like [Pieris brassicae]|uniref:gamma-interferon-inducible lysosomal thiol reductase-like n=1 Tax=Pieris brassicae TaxID=7116 RepID=UPI001E65E83B|nr:gamma-interferon-inducible lysosomal thiol reductase-like [Pieris brassicae]
MGFYLCSRYRIIVLILVVLIMWQIYANYSHFMLKKSTTTSASNIVQLEDDSYNTHKQDKVKVRVYYETLCPDSKHFFVRHLGPVTEKLSDFLDVTLVPYGKATTTEKNGQYYFKCQHQEEECYANKIHACSIDILNNIVLAVKITVCMIEDNYDADGALHKCAKQLNIEPEPIINCAGTTHGSELLKKYGDDTHILKPTFIPTVTLNGSRDNQAAILKNFLLEVCKLIAMPLPPPCL